MHQLMKLMWAQPEITLPDEIVEKAATSPFEGVELYRHPGHASFKGGDNPPQQPMAPRRPPGFLVEIESQVRQYWLAFCFCH